MIIVYIGEEFYSKSRTIMSSLYRENGQRFDWGFVQIALKNGHDVHIRQATTKEMDHYKSILSVMLRKED